MAAQTTFGFAFLFVGGQFGDCPVQRRGLSQCVWSNRRSIKRLLAVCKGNIIKKQNDLAFSSYQNGFKPLSYLMLLKNLPHPNIQLQSRLFCRSNGTAKIDIIEQQSFLLVQLLVRSIKSSLRDEQVKFMAQDKLMIQMKKKMTIKGVCV